METVVHTSLSPITSIRQVSSRVSGSRSRNRYDQSDDEDDDDKQDNRKPAAEKRAYSDDESLSDSSQKRKANLNDQEDEMEEHDHTEYATSSARAKQGFIPAPVGATGREKQPDRMYESATLASGVDLTMQMQQGPSYRWNKIDDEMKLVTIDKTSVAEFVITSVFPKLKFITGAGINLDYCSDKRSICSLVLAGCNKVHSKEGIIWWETAKKQVTMEIKRLRNDATKSMKYAFLGK
jgi:hypothetical protein